MLDICMIDIVNFSGDMFELGYSKVYHTSNINIAYGNKDNRKTVENRKIDMLVSPERETFGRNLVTMDSGLNEVICRLANKHNVAVGISFHDILTSKNRNELLAKIMQNVRLCRKYKVKMVMASFAGNKFEMRHSKDMYNFCLVLGMNDKEAKEALNFKKKEDEVRFI